ncbi:MAG: MMPL family transporter [Lachnospiraceae bacterium]|nr:MMPL family transporter [Lachnospiraceae bacterium]
MLKKKLAAGIVRARFLLLALTLAAAAFSAASIGRTIINYDLTKYLSEDTMTRRALAVMEEEFGASEQLRVMFADQEEAALERYVSAINDLPGVLLAAHDPETGVRVADGVTWQLVTVSLNSGSAAETVKQLRGMFPETGRYYVGGSAAGQLDLQQSVAEEIPEVLVIAVVIVLLVLLATSHAWLEPVPVLAVLGVSILINMGTNFVFPSVSFITFAVSAILQMALSIDYAIMLLHTYNGYRDGGLDAKEAMTEALAECFMRITSSAMTTVAGLLSLLFMSFTFGADIGMVLSKGIVCSLLGVFLLMPALILLMEKPLRRTRHRPLKLGGEHLARAVARGRYPAAALLILLVLGGLYLNSRNEFSFTTTEEKANSDSSQITARFGTSNPLVLLVPGGEEDADYARQRVLAEQLQKIRKADGSPAVSAVTSLVTTGEMALRYYTPQEAADLTGVNPLAVRLFYGMQGFGDAVRGDRLLEAASSLAPDNEDLREMQELWQTAREAFIGSAHDRMIAEISFTTSDPHSAEYMEQILAAASAVYGDDYYVTGVPMSNYDIARAFRGDLIRVNIITALAILLIVTVSFRAFALPLLLVFVIEGAIWITMGASRLAGKPVFFISYLICLSIQMGATIDYGILVADQYRNLRRKGLAPEAALQEGMKKSLPTVLTSGIILITAGFVIGIRCSIFYISDIGLLVSRGALVSAALVLTLLPALLLICDKVIVREKKTGPVQHRS